LPPADQQRTDRLTTAARSAGCELAGAPASRGAGGWLSWKQTAAENAIDPTIIATDIIFGAIELIIRIIAFNTNGA
jgi:hypothetical protein